MGPAHQETLAYYSRNALLYAERSWKRIDLGPIKEFVSRLPSGARVLDAACGAGRDLSYFANQGFQAEGFDACPELVQYASEKSQSKVWQADLLLLSLPKESYDGIWANRCLIHMNPPGCQRTLASFFAALKPKGILYVSIEVGEPAEGEPNEIIQDRTDDAQGPARHIFRYRADDFASLIRQSGFQLLAQGRELESTNKRGFIARRLG